MAVRGRRVRLPRHRRTHSLNRSANSFPQSGSRLSQEFTQNALAEAVVGVLGGGQLGRMLALAAANLGISVRCLDPTPNAPASVAAEQVIGHYQNRQEILQFARECDVLTVEIEHVDVPALKEIKRTTGISIHPSPESLEIIQDKFRQKQHFKANGIHVPPVTEISDVNDLYSVCEKQLPIMLKSRRMAYDGRGNYAVRHMDQIETAIDALGGTDSGLYAEEWVKFAKELAVIVTRQVLYPVTETIHRDSICFVTESPASIDYETANRAKSVAEKAVRCLDGAGVFGVELFLMDDGAVLLNEIAPRPHNSGHYTIDACYTSQFEQHIRAVLGLSLGNPSLKVGCAIMLNLLGQADGQQGMLQAQSTINKALSIPGACVHWYKKSTVSKNRKIGHINLLGDDRAQALNKLHELDSCAHAALVHGSSTEDIPVVPATLASIIMGSDSDLPTMKHAADVLESFGIRVEVTIVSAHRTPQRMLDFAKTAHERGIKVIIAGAGGAAHLPGMVAALSPLPVIGVPCVPKGSHLDGLDALASIVQMPKGIPVATVAIGNAVNAGLLAVRILSVQNPALVAAMLDYQAKMKETVMQKVERIENEGWRDI